MHWCGESNRSRHSLASAASLSELSPLRRMQCVSIRPPGAQLLGLCLLGALEIIVGLHEEKPSRLPVADPTCLLQVLFGFAPQQIDAAHASTPMARTRAIGASKSWQNVGALLVRPERSSSEHPSPFFARIGEVSRLLAQVG